MDFELLKKNHELYSSKTQAQLLTERQERLNKGLIDLRNKYRYILDDPGGENIDYIREGFK